MEDKDTKASTVIGAKDAGISISQRSREYICVAEKEEKQSAESIVPGMRQHAWTQAATLHCEEGKHSAEQGDRDDACGSFVEMRAAEEQRACSHADPHLSACERRELLLEVTAEEQLLTETGGETQQQKEQQLR